MQYDPIKRSLGNIFNRSSALRKLFYSLLDLLLLRAWHVHKELKKFTVYGLQFTVEEADIYNSLGALIRKSNIVNRKSGATFGSIEVDVSNLPPGIYFVQLIGASKGTATEERWTGKFVKE